MISIIICSRSSDISSVLKENIQNTIGIDYEIIVINNSENNYSIFSAYNKGVNLSNFPYLCFVHEDVLFRTNDWGNELIGHLKDRNTGIIGIAGGKVMTKIPAQWSSEGKYKNIIQHRKNKVYTWKEPQGFQGISQSAILLDGVFLSMRRELFDKISFDEKIKGFHGYDCDICAQSIIAGFTNYVVYDILLEHFSGGNGDAQFYNNLITIYKKWEEHLPLLSPDVPDIIRSRIDKIEIKRLRKLIAKMVSTGFSTKSIVKNASYFVGILDTNEAKKILIHIRLKIFFLRLFRKPKYLFCKSVYS
ncbi:MAG: glycosyltransferase [Paludibacter sp.]|nr:glycosyltransferase [Paludibacter sp.]